MALGESESLKAGEDLALISRLVDGDERAFRSCWEFYHPRLLRFASRYITSADVTDDIVQQVFLTLWQERASLVLKDTLAPWLYRTTRNRILDTMRQERSRRQREIVLTPEIQIPTREQADQNLEAQETAVQVTTLLQSVPPRAREIFLLNRIEGLTPAEIAKVLEIQPQVVYNQLSRVIKALAEGLGFGR